MLKLENIEFSYKNQAVLKNINITIQNSDRIAVLGESGCGKSTLLHLIYGLLQEDQGTIQYNNTTLLGASHHLVPGHEMMKYVPQEFHLMPYTSVFENVGTHLSIQDDQREKKIMDLLELVDMMDYKNSKIKDLSGGQKQRVAIAKALAQQPQILLLDEPFSNIDHFRKNKLRRRIFQYIKEQKITCIVATHDKDDVLSFCNTCIIMKKGSIIDHRNTQEVYQRPINRYAAALFDEVSELALGTFKHMNKTLYYPHEIELSTTGIDVQVQKSYFKGSHYLIKAMYKSQPVFFNHNSILRNSQMLTVNLKK